MTALPNYKKNKYDLLKPGKYTFRITEQPEQRRFGPTKRVGIILSFSAINEFGEMEESSCLIWPGDVEYRILKDEIIKSSEEADWVGKSFLGEIEIGPHPTKDDREMQKIVNVQPFPKADGPLATKEEEPVDTTPPPEEPGDPGPKDPYPKEDDDDAPPF